MSARAVKSVAGLLTAGGFGAYTYSKYKKGAFTAFNSSSATGAAGSETTEEETRLKSKILRRKTRKIKNLESFSACRPLVVCGPSGVGKSTMIKRLVADYPDDFGFSVSHTTRDPRTGETDGIDYHFTTTEDMLEMIKDGKFIEHAHVHNKIYGTSIRSVTDVTHERQICILDIDVQGVQTVMESAAHTELNPKYLFVRPVSIDVLEKRLISRATDSLAQIAVRVKTASFEMEVAAELPFDEVIVNDELEKAYLDLKTFIDAQRKLCKDCRDRESTKK